MHKAVRQNIQKELARLGLDAYLALTPANFFYTSGYFSDFLEVSWRMTGTDMVVVPADPAYDPVLIVSEYVKDTAARKSDIADIRCFPLWMDVRPLDVVTDLGQKGDGSPLRLNFPEQYDAMQIAQIVGSVLNEWQCGAGRIATDLNLAQVGTFNVLRQACPNATFVDFTDSMNRLRAVKHPEEIEHLKNATRVFEHMMDVSFAGIKEGYTLEEMDLLCRRSALDFTMNHPEIGTFMGAWVFNSVGDGSSNAAQQGDLIKIDAGARINGYYSDCARVAVLGSPSDDVLLIDRALQHGYDAALSMLVPGNTMQMVFDAALLAVRENGLPNYSRGHFGHSIGLEDLIEEPPFIGPNDTVLEPGMVLCLELPYYPRDTGGYNIEDHWLVTDTGAESMNSSSRSLVMC